MWSRLGIWERNAAGFRFAGGWNVRRVQGQVWGKRDIGASMAWREQARGCAEEMFGERGGWWALHRQQLSFRSGVQSRLMFEMCGGWAELFFLCRIFYFVRRERKTDGRKASSLACGRVAAPLMAILLTAGRFGYGLLPDVQARGDIVDGARGVLSGGGWGGLVMSCRQMCRCVVILPAAVGAVWL